MKNSNILSETTTFWKYHRSNLHGTVKKSFRFAASTLWNSLPDHFRTEIASLNSRVFCSPGMGPNVAVLHVDD
jgi:hypothetical protein